MTRMTLVIRLEFLDRTRVRYGSKNIFISLNHISDDNNNDYLHIFHE